MFIKDVTEEMYVFLEIQMPEYTDSSLPEFWDSLIYTYEVNEEWTLVESGKGIVVYAYGSADMTTLQPGESTSALITQMIMKSTTNAEYAAIDNINIMWIHGIVVWTIESQRSQFSQRRA